MSVKSWKPPADLPPQPHLAALASATGWPIATLRSWKAQGAITPNPDGTWSPHDVYKIAQTRFQTKVLDVLTTARKKAQARDSIKIQTTPADPSAPSDPSSAEGARHSPEGEGGTTVTISRSDSLTLKHYYQARKAQLEVAERERQLVTVESLRAFLASLAVEFIEGQKRIGERLTVYLTPEQRKLLHDELADNARRIKQFLSTASFDHPK